MKKNAGIVVKGGIGIVGLLQIAFIILKICKVITWSWWAVMLPTIISEGLFVLLIIGIILYDFFKPVDKL